MLQIVSISVRKARTSDIVLITDFNARMALETERKKLDLNVLRRGVTAVISNPAKGTYYVAESDGEVVGQTLVTYEWSDWRNGTFWWIQSVYVPEQWRGKKVFATLYKHIEQMAQSAPAVCGLRLYVERHNARAQATYEKLGMTKTEYDLFERDFTRTVP